MKQMKFFAALAAFALCIGGCSGGGSDEPEEVVLKLSVNPTTIVANGTDAATFTLTADGKEIQASRYMLLTSTNEPVNGGRFTTTTAGAYTFYALYNNKQSNSVSVTATEPQPEPTPNPNPNPEPAPEPDGSLTLPADPQPENLNFFRRVMLIQFTGTNCGFCPFMINAITETLQDQTLASQVVWTAAHRYNDSDPAYCSFALDYMMGVSGFPMVSIDMANLSGNRTTSAIKKMINDAISRVSARGGISAASSYDSATRTVTIKAEVKAAEKRQFRIGAWLLEDGIEARQANNGAPGSWANYVHNECIRLQDSMSPDNDYTGKELGDLEAGAKGVCEFSIKLRENYKAENCRVVLFITTPEVAGSGKAWRVNNIITMPMTGQAAYEYVK